MPANKKYNRKWLRLIFILYPLLSVVGFALPFIGTYFINRALGKIKGFAGHIESIRMTPFVMNLGIKGFFLDIVKRSTKERSLFLSAESIDIKIDWIKLWDGTLWCELKCKGPNFTFSKGAFEGSGNGNSLYRLNTGMEIFIKKAEISGGKLEFADATTDPHVLIQISNVEVKASDMPIGIFHNDRILSDVLVNAAFCKGKLNANMKVDLLSPTPDFVMDAGISEVDMVSLNDFFRAYGKFDIHSGIMGMHMETTARDKKYKGYVESIIKDLEVIGPEDDRDSGLKFLWKVLLGTVAELTEDHSKEELAARVDFEAPFKNPEVHIGIAVLEVLTNAFLHGLTPYMKNEVKIDL